MKEQYGGIDERLIALEEKLEYQDYTVEKLNDVIILQQQQIDGLEEKVARLSEKMEGKHLEMETGDQEPLPPHY